MSTNTIRPRALGLLLLLAIAAGCPQAPEPTPAGRCDEPAEGFEPPTDCVVDDHCACGTRCALGECTADCATDADCGGGTCDRLGRCRAPTDTAFAPPPPAFGPAPLVTSRSRLRFRATGDETALTLTPKDRAAGRIRVVAPDGYSVACEGNDFVSECFYAGLAAFEGRTVLVRLDADLAEVEPGALRVFHGADRYSVSLTAQSQGPQQPPGGVYSGAASLTTVGVALDGTEIPPTLQGLSLPLTAEVHVDEGASTGAR
jgi:hypothetical protein